MSKLKSLKRKLFDSSGDAQDQKPKEKCVWSKTVDERKISISQGKGQHCATDCFTPERFHEPMRALTERQQLALLLQMTASQYGNDSLKTPKSSQQRNEKNFPKFCRATRHLFKRNERGETPLHLATIRGSLKQVKRLLRLGVDVNCSDFAGWTPLHEACNYGWFGIAQLLLKAGAEVNAKGLDDITPLHDAAVNGHIELVGLLLQHGAVHDSLSIHGKTPLNLASDEQVIQLLKSKSDFGTLISPSLFKTAETAGITSKSAVAGGFLSHHERSAFPGAASLVDQLTSHHLIYNTISKSITRANNMRKSSPQHQTPRGPDKPSSPRLTLRFQPIKSRDDRHGGGGTASSKSSEVSSSEPRYQSYCVTMETSEEDVYEFKKDVPRSSSSTPDSDATATYDQQLNVVSSSSRQDGASSVASLQTHHHHHHHHHSGAGTTSATDGVKEYNNRTRTMENHVISPPNGASQPNERHGKSASLSSDGEVVAISSKSQSGKNGESGSNHVLIHSECDEASESEQDENRRKRKRESKDGGTEHASKVTGSSINSSSGMSMSLRNHSREKVNLGLEDRRCPSEGQLASNSITTVVSKVAHVNSGSETESTQSDAENDGCSGGSGPHGLPKVPPLKIVIPPTALSEQDRCDRSKLTSRPALPYVVNTASGSSNDNLDSKNAGGDIYSGSTALSCGSDVIKEDNKVRDSSTGSHSEERSHRVTRSSQRMAALANASTSNNAVRSTASPTFQFTGVSAEGGSNGSPPAGQDLGSAKNKFDLSSDGYAEQEQQQSNGPTDMHPRKRKLRTRDSGGHSSEVNSVGHSSSASSSWSSASSHCDDQAILNCYEMFLNIRKQIDRRRRNMFVVQPKLPESFKDYLMNRCSYVLAGNTASRLSVPTIPPPQSLTGPMKELFVSQEKERYNLRLQHLIEKEKLVLTVEQEILRVHGKAARASKNQMVPLSVCTILKDEEVYNLIEPGQEEKEKNARARFTPRQLLSWLQDVHDKWEKVKEAMLLRHHNEAESLHAAQKLDWEWKMKELGTCDFKSTPVIDGICVPMVHVSDEFELLPT